MNTLNYIPSHIYTQTCQDHRVPTFNIFIKEGGQRRRFNPSHLNIFVKCHPPPSRVLRKREKFEEKNRAKI